MNSLIKTVNAVTMTSREMADLTEKRHDSVKRTIDTLAEKGTVQLPQIVEVTNHLGQVVTEYRIGKRDSFVVVAQLSPEFTARIVDRWQELEAQQYVPTLPNYAEALRQLADKLEENQTLSIERDHAIKTKAQISSKREATAMATASKNAREVAKLKDQLGFSARQATVMQVEAAMGCSFKFVDLRRWCKANGVHAETVPDKRYPIGVKAWPAGAWMAVYGVDLAELFGEVLA